MGARQTAKQPGPLKRACLRLKRSFELATAESRVFPDFIILGAMRAGTTGFYHYMGKHPLILTVRDKELHFFDEQVVQGLDWYRSFFPLRCTMRYKRLRFGYKAVTGEASPYYLVHPALPGRIGKALPDVRLIAFLRNPVDRAISHYHFSARLGYETLPMAEAMEKEEERLAGEEERLLEDPYYRSVPHRRFSYKTRGIYVDQLRRWHEHFPRHQLLIVKSEDYFTRPETVFPRVCEFLGLRPWTPKDVRRMHHWDLPETERAVREQLREFFKPHNERLYKYLGVDWDWNEAPQGA